MHYYQFNIGNYRRDTMHLSLIEHAIYRNLIDTYYLEEQPLCDDHAKLMRTHCIRSADEVQALENVLQDFFIHDEKAGLYRHPDIDEHLAKYAEKSEKARKSAQSRWKKCERNANAQQTQSEGNANHKPITNNHKPITNIKENTSGKPDTSAEKVFDYWVKVMGKNNQTRFTEQRKKAVKARLKNYSGKEICTAIANCARSSFHMGDNDTGTVYNDLTLICRNDTKLEYFRDLVEVTHRNSSHDLIDSMDIDLGEAQ